MSVRRGLLIWRLLTIREARLTSVRRGRTVLILRRCLGVVSIHAVEPVCGVSSLSRPREPEFRAQGCPGQGVGHAVVLLQVLVLKGDVAVVHRHRQLSLAQQPLLCEVVIYPV